MAQNLWAKMVVPVGPGGYEPGFVFSHPDAAGPKPGGFVSLEMNADLEQCTAEDHAFLYELLEATLQHCRAIRPLQCDRSGPEPGDGP